MNFKKSIFARKNVDGDFDGRIHAGSFRDKKHLIENFTEEIKLLVMGKQLFEQWDQSFKFALYKFWTIKILMLRKKSKSFERNRSPPVGSFKLRPRSKVWNLYFCIMEFQHHGNSLLIGLFGIISSKRSRNNIMQHTYFWRVFIFLPKEKLGW